MSSLQKWFFHSRKKTKLFAFEYDRVFIKFDNKISKYESNENCRPKLHILGYAIYNL